MAQVSECKITDNNQSFQIISSIPSLLVIVILAPQCKSLYMFGGWDGLMDVWNGGGGVDIFFY